jgi:hypothetical protein
MASNLLTLPREIRKIIYPHLSHTLEFTWPWRTITSVHTNMEPRTMTPYGTVQVQLHNAPDTGALSTHSRIRDGCIQEARMSPLEVTTVLPVFYDDIEDTWHNTSTDPDERARAAFKHVKHATLYIDCGLSRNRRSSNSPRRTVIDKLLAHFCELRQIWQR